MASQTHHLNKKTGVTYVYSVESYWDKEKKAPRNRQVCIGKLDKATGEIIASQRKSKDFLGSSSVHFVEALYVATDLRWMSSSLPILHSYNLSGKED